MDTASLYQYNPWWEDSSWHSTRHLFRREILERKIFTHLESKSRAILFLTGLRRVGKTSLMKISISKLLKDNVNRNHIFYMSLDDYALKDATILEIIQEYKAIHKIKYDTPCYLFLDEITYKADFRQQLKNLHDNTTNKILVSASSSSALRDKRGWLTGREINLEVLPLTFEEYLEFKQIKIKQRDSAFLRQYFEEYMQIGGMPEYVLTGERAYLVSLIEDIISKDIISHYGVKEPQIIRDYFTLLMERSGKQCSINKISHILNISPDTAKRYLNMFAESYLIHLVPRFGTTNEQLLSAKKVYAADLGIKNIVTGFRDKGAIFENYVYLSIKNLDPKYVYQDSTEIDFFTKTGTLIEVKYNQILEAKQKKLFDEFPASTKYLISKFEDIGMIIS